MIAEADAYALLGQATEGQQVLIFLTLVAVLFCVFFEVGRRL